MKRDSRRAAAKPQSKSRVAAASVATLRPSLSRKRLWLFRVVALVLVPAIFLLLIEGVLRVAGFGHPTGFFLPARINRENLFVPNDRFGWRFFGPELSRQPFPCAVSQSKPANTIRVFVFGESAAYGDPQPEFGLPRMLEALF